MLQSCLTPELAAEITVQPVRRYGVDAAILFSDIVVPLFLAGVDVDIRPGVGPVMTPVRTAADVAALRPLDPDRLAPVQAAAGAAVELLAQHVGDSGRVPLIGFAGAPFTLASYLVEGGPSRDHLRTRALMHSEPQTWNALLTWTASLSSAFLKAQIAGGAEAVQLFDSWVGALSVPNYDRFVLEHSRVVFESVALLRAVRSPGASVPTVHFGTGTGELLASMRRAGAGCVGVDYRTPLDVAIERLGGSVPVQGNIDPALLLAPWPVLQEHVLDVVRAGLAAPGHVVNLGHGVPPDADPDQLHRVVELVHSLESAELVTGRP
jgi:uroporphyrinogen decarboxylase